MKKYVYNGETVELVLDNYTNNYNTAVILKTEDEDTLVISTNIAWLTPYTFTADINNYPDIENFLIDNGIAKPTGGHLTSGYCKYPIYALSEELIPDDDED